MSTSDHLAVFRDAAAHREILAKNGTRAMDDPFPWERLGRALSALEAGSAPDGTTWIAEACRISTYSSNQLRRAERTLAFLHELESRNEIPAPAKQDRKAPKKKPSAADYYNAPITNLDVISRWYRFDPTKAIERLQTVHDDAYRNLLGDFDHAKANEKRKSAAPDTREWDRRSGPMAEKAFYDRVFRVIRTWFPLAKWDVREPHKRLPNLSPDIIIWPLAKPRYHAVYIRGLAIQPRPGAHQTFLHEICFAASYFYSLSVILPTEVAAQQLASELDEIGQLANIRVAYADVRSGELHLVRRRHGVPVPDRRADLTEFPGWPDLKRV
jgi:hypothetical protein